MPKKMIYVGNGLAMTREEFIKAKKRFYKMATRRKLKKTRKVY
jgi:hypothetical protein